MLLLVSNHGLRGINFKLLYTLVSTSVLRQRGYPNPACDILTALLIKVWLLTMERESKLSPSQPEISLLIKSDSTTDKGILFRSSLVMDVWSYHSEPLGATIPQVDVNGRGRHTKSFLMGLPAIIKSTLPWIKDSIRVREFPFTKLNFIFGYISCISFAVRDNSLSAGGLFAPT